MHTDRIKKAKAHLALNPARDVKGNKGCYRCTNSTREKRGPLLNGARDLVKRTNRRLRYNALFTLFFIGGLAFRSPRPWHLWESLEQGRPLVEKDQVREHLNKQDVHKSMGPDRMHP